jgi:hypothetical protein
MLGGYREFAIEKGFLLSISSRWNGAIVDRSSGASADSFTVTGSDSDGPVSVDLGEGWPSRLVATAEEIA